MMDVTEQGVKIIECPRDAMQGLHGFVPTEVKVNYLNTLLKVGFDTLDFGSFVSPKAIPQMKDTAEVLEKLQLHDTQTKLLAIIANTRGAEQAVRFPECRNLPAMGRSTNWPGCWHYRTLGYNWNRHARQHRLLV